MENCSENNCLSHLYKHPEDKNPAYSSTLLMFHFSRFHSHTYNQRRGVTLSLKVRWVLGRRGEHIRPDKTAFPVSFIAHESRAQWRYGTGIVAFLHDYNQTISHSTGFHNCNISSADLITHSYGVCIFY